MSATGATAPRLHVAGATLSPHAEFDLPEAAARHALVRRVQPGHALRLFNGFDDSGTEWPAEVLAITRSAVRVRLGAEAGTPAAAELPLAVTLAFGMPANERVDALVEKASELGVAALQPLMSERSVLRLSGERAERRRAHWQAVAVSACEQCGRARVPVVQAVQDLLLWLPEAGPPRGARSLHEAQPARAAQWLLSTRGDATQCRQAWAAAAAAPAGQPTRVVLLSGPEGGLAEMEESSARAAGFVAVTLGPRILRADTAPLAALAWLALSQPA